MEISLDDNQVQEIRTLIFSTVQDGIKQATNTRPYLNRKDIAKYLGVAESTITYWASLGMPVAIIDGRKLYGNKVLRNGLKPTKCPLKSHKSKQKSP